MEALMITARKTISLHRAFRLSSASFSSSYERAERENARLEVTNNDPVQGKSRVNEDDMEGAKQVRDLAGKMRQAAGNTAEFVADAAAEGTRRVAKTAEGVGDTMGKIKDSVVGDNEGEVKVGGTKEIRADQTTGWFDELRSTGGYDKNAD